MPNYKLSPFVFPERFGVGQNLYIYKQTRQSAATDWTRAIKDWYDEVKLFSRKSVKPFRFSTRWANNFFALPSLKILQENCCATQTVVSAKNNLI